MFNKYTTQNFGSGFNFELEIRSLLRTLGLSAETTGNDDRGVDIIAEANLGDSRIKFFIQCKYHNKTVGLEAVQEVYTGASLRNNEGFPVVITNNKVTHEARKAAVKLGVEIIADREWQELQDCYTNYAVPDKTHFGLMGIMLGAITGDYEHVGESADDLTKSRQKLIPNENMTQDEQQRLDHNKQIVKEKYDEALSCEQQAAELDRKASYLRQTAITLQKEATLNLLDYG